MKTPMLFSQTYEVVTHESAELGESDERGFDWQGEAYTFSELVHLLRRDYIGAEGSDSHSGAPRWITAYGDQDWRDGSYRSISLHPDNDRAVRYWPLALRAAGVVS